MSYISLHNFVVHSSANKEIDVKKEILEFKRIHQNQVPTIVFDFNSSTTVVIPLAYKIRKWEILYAGRPNLCIKRAEKFFEELKELGVKLVFFLDGPIKNDKLPIWLKRKENMYNQQKSTIFNKLEHVKEIQFAGDFINSYFENFLNVAKKYGEIKISFENECDIDLAHYASQVNAMAIVANDLDFCLMPGNWKIWSSKFFDIKKWKTKETNKTTLRNLLQLNENQMPILSVIWKYTFATPNEFGTWNNSTFKNILPTAEEGTERLSKYINSNFPSGIPLSNEKFKKLCNVIYDNGNFNNTFKYIEEKVKLTLDLYDYDTRKECKVTPEWLEKHINYTHMIIVYIFLKGLPVTIGHRFIDLSVPKTRPFANLVIPLILRQMGIVLYNKKNEEQKIVIHFKSSDVEPYKSEEFSPQYPKKSIPNIEDIINYENNNDNNNISLKEKFEILSWIITSEFEEMDFSIFSELQNIKFLIPVITLYYLVKEKHFEIEEADLILLSIYEAIENSDNYDFKTFQCSAFDQRAFWIAFTYTEIIYYFINALTVCGLYDYNEFNYFDGFIFHTLYSRKDSLEFASIEKYRIYTQLN